MSQDERTDEEEREYVDSEPPFDAANGKKVRRRGKVKAEPSKPGSRTKRQFLRGREVRK